MISLKQLTYALAVEKTLHFKQAAEHCHVSQSALSTALTELEKQLGFQVFERDNKKVLVTPLGQQLLDKARRIKLEVDELYQLGQVQNAPLTYPITLGVIPSIGPYLLPKVLPELRRQHPQLQLRIIEEQSRVLIEQVRSGAIDAAIMALPYPIDGLLSFEFWQEDFYYITHREDSEAADRLAISSADLDQSRLMLLKDGHCLKEHALAACKLERGKASEAFDSTSLHTLIQMVAGRIGSTLVPEMALSQLVDGNAEIKSMHLDEPGPHRRIAFVVRPSYVGVHNIQALMALFKGQLSADDAA